MKERLNMYRQAVYQTLKTFNASDNLDFANFRNAEASYYQFLTTPNQKVLLLLGNGLSGKTTLCHRMIQVLLEAKTESAFIPVQCEVADFEDLAGSLKEKFAKFRIEFSAEEAISLKDYPFVFIVDDYEPQGYFPNLYINGRLFEWQKSKFLISCYSPHLLHEEHYPLYFMPFYQEEPQPQQLMEIKLGPLTVSEIDVYLQHNLKENWELVKALLANEPMLYELLGNPFLLKQFASLSPASLTNTSIIVEHLMKTWFAEYTVKMSQQADARNEAFDATWLSYYSIALARCLEEQKDNPDHSLLNSLVPNSRKVWFDHSRPEFRWGWRAAPLIADPGSDRYQFIGSTLLQRYFLCLQVTAKFVFVEELDTSSEKSSSLNQQHEAKKYKNLLCDSLMNQKLYTGDENKLELMADDIVRYDVSSEAFKKQLFSFVSASKNNSKLSILAANAITILNIGRVSFSGMNLAEINISGANLNYSMLDSVQLKDANLENISLQGSWLRNANLSGAKMKGVYLGEKVGLKLKNRAKAFCYSPNGYYFAVGQSESIELYESETLKLFRIFKGLEDDIFSIDFQPQGLLLASGGSDRTICLWNIKEENHYTFRGHTERVRSISFHPQGQLLASGSDDKTIRLWDTQKNKLIGVLGRHDGYVWSVAFHPQGNILASGSYDETIRLWNILTKECIRIFKVGSPILSISFHPKGSFLASGNWDKTVRLWNIDNGECQHTFEGHTDYVRSVSFHSTGQLLASAGSSGDRTICLWDIEKRKSLHTFEGHTKAIQIITFSPKDQLLASLDEDNAVHFWNINQKQYVHPQENGHAMYITDIAFHLQKCLLASGSWDKTIRLWDMKRKRYIGTLEGHNQFINTVAFHPRGNILASGGDDKTIRLWDTQKNKLVGVLGRHNGYVWSVAFHPQGNILASGGDDKIIRLWDIENKKCLSLLEGHEDGIKCVSFHPQGNILASGSHDKSIRLWNIQKGQYFVLGSHDGSVWSIAFHPQGNILASGGDDKAIRLWDIENKQCLQILKGHENSIERIVFCQEGQLLASASWDETVRLWDMENKQCLGVIKGFNGAVWGLNWMPLLQKSISNTLNFFLLTGGQDKVISCWQVNYPPRNRKIGVQKLEILLLWRSHTATLTADGATITQEKLEYENYQLLKQRGAVDHNWGNFGTKEIADKVFRFFNTKNLKNVGCVSKDCNKLQKEIENESIIENGSIVPK